MLIALVAWASPIHVTAQTKTASLPEAIEISTSSHDVQAIESSPLRTAPKNGPSVAQVFSRRGNGQEDQSTISGRHYSAEGVQALIIQYSEQYGISAALPLRVAECESGFNQFSRNKHSSASGVFQYLASTWRNTEAGKAGINVFDADANIHMAIKSIASGGISNWAASRSCWSK